MLKLFCLLAILLFNGDSRSSLSQASKIDSNVASKLEKGEKVNVVVSFHKGITSALDVAKSFRNNNDRSERNKAIVQALQENADTTQKGVMNLLSARSGSGFQYFRTYWTSNRMFVKEADAATVKAIEEDTNVSQIKLEPKIRFPENPETPTQETSSSDSQPRLRWNINHVKAPEAWEELGNRGEGVVVANIDSGVRHTHKSLNPSFRGEYGWLDAVNGSMEPYDFDYHGTGMMGILVGGDYVDERNKSTPIGMAPGAKWMACRGCDGLEPGNECKFEHVMDCIKFISCPTLPDGSNPDCSKAPHVLSFSLAAGRMEEGLNDDFLTMKELGIISVAAAGNYGPRCATTDNPANMPYVFGVGSINSNDIIVGSSSLGPTPNGTIKPDIVAPGYLITSTASTGDDHYYNAGGTSAATPHVAGLVALLHVRKPDLTFEEAYQLITQNAVTKVTTEQQEFCNESTAAIPNNIFGYGRLDALATVKAQTALLSSKKASK